MDNISRSGLVNMCRYMGVPPFGNDNFLRYQLRSKLRAITQVIFCVTQVTPALWASLRAIRFNGSK